MLGHILPACAGLSPEITLARLSANGEVAKHGEYIEHGGFPGAVPSDNQLLGRGLELEVYKAAIIGRVESGKHSHIVTQGPSTSFQVPAVVSTGVLG